MDGTDTGDDSVWSNFADFLEASSRVLCLVGAGLSAPSGLATWRGTNGLWNDLNLRDLASPNKFKEDPVTVWSFYGLLEQTDHPMSRLLGIHGTLKIVRCTTCDYNTNVHTPHDIPFLLSLSNANDQPRSAALSDLPHCPKCANLLRPGVVWFGERLAAGAPDSIDEWMSQQRIDLVIAAGTSLEVFPAAEWVNTARTYGASLLVIDTEKDHQLVDELNDNDWFFKGDIAVILPRIVNLLER